MFRRFEIEEKITRQYKQFHAIGTLLIVRLLPPYTSRNPFSHFLASVNDLFDNALQNFSDSDMVGIKIQKRVNQNDEPIGISFRRKNQLAGDVLWRVFESHNQTLDSTPWTRW